MGSPTTGIEALDELIGGLQIGDNVVLRTPSGHDAEPLIRGALRAASGHDRLVYASLRDAPLTLYERYEGLWDPERFVLLDYRAGRGQDEPPPGMRVQHPSEEMAPAALGRTLIRIGREWGPGTHYVVDGLTDIKERWGDDAVLDLFLSTCPALYEQRTIAYWTLQRHAHSRQLLSQLADITQIVLDLDREDGELVVELHKAAGRPDHLRGGRLHLAVDGDDVRVVRRMLGTREHIGHLIRQRREVLGLSQAELARRVGVTPSALSQAERGVHGLSGDVLTRVWEELHVPFGPEAEAMQPALEVFRRGRTAASVRGGVRGESLVNRPELGAHLLQFPADSSGSGGPFATKQREFVVVLDGVLELRVGRSAEILQAGDAALITREPVGSWSNPGIDEARVLWILLP